MGLACYSVYSFIRCFLRGERCEELKDLIREIYKLTIWTPFLTLVATFTLTMSFSFTSPEIREIMRVIFMPCVKMMLVFGSVMVSVLVASLHLHKELVKCNSLAKNIVSIVSFIIGASYGLLTYFVTQTDIVVISVAITILLTSNFMVQVVKCKTLKDSWKRFIK